MSRQTVQRMDVYRRIVNTLTELEEKNGRGLNIGGLRG